MDTSAKDKDNTQAPDDGATADKNCSSRLSKQGFLLFKEALSAIVDATHKLTCEQSITITEYAAILAKQGVPDEWIIWLTDTARDMQDEKNRL